MKRELLSGDLDSIPPKITRALEDGLDYRPDWRDLQVQKYLNSTDQSDAEALTQLDEILSEEPDPFVRDLLLFHWDRPCGNKECIAYAVNCQRDNSKTLSASVIKTMVIANVSPERIADEFGTNKEKIETFEKLYFDARPYLKCRGWLKGILCPVGKPANAVVAKELRWFRVASRMPGNFTPGTTYTLLHAGGSLGRSTFSSVSRIRKLTIRLSRPNLILRF